MPLAVTLAELVETAQQLANKVAGDDGQIETPEWKAHISSWYGRVHAVVADTAARLFETETTLNLAALTLPSDHRSTIGVDFVDASGRRRELPELMYQERNVFGLLTGDARAWSFSGTAIKLYPLPTSGTYKHLYVPQPTRYNTATDATSVDVLTSDGLDAITWGAASVALHRGESQQQRALGEATAALKNLREWAVGRSMTMPKRQQIMSMGDYSDRNGAWNPASWRWNR